MAKPDKTDPPQGSAKPRRGLGLIVKGLGAVLLLALGFGGGAFLSGGALDPAAKVRQIVAGAASEPAAGGEQPATEGHAAEPAQEPAAPEAEHGAEPAAASGAESAPDHAAEPAAGSGHGEAAAEGAASETTASETTGTPRLLPKPTPKSQEFLTTYFEFPDTLTTNLRDTSQILQIKIGVATHYDQRVIDNVSANLQAMKSDVLSVIGGFAAEDIAGKEGRDRLANALRDAINARLTDLTGFGGIESVYFSSFIVQ